MKHSELAGTLQTDLLDQYMICRNRTCALADELLAEDMNLQTADFASPGKWHFAHTSWFFETFLLKTYLPGYQEFNPSYVVLFNSYYNGVGPQHPRANRSFLSRPPLEEVMDYRAHVDDFMLVLLKKLEEDDDESARQLARLGIEHEKQHQELFLTDLKYNLFQNPLRPHAPIAGFDEGKQEVENKERAFDAIELSSGSYEIGAPTVQEGISEFCFDNELPRHATLLTDCRVDASLVSNREFLEFVLAGGYQRADLWLADGWQAIKDKQWTAPLYWSLKGSHPQVYTLTQGMVDLDMDAPVAHISGYEADAYATFKGARLPTEMEWEVAARQNSTDCGHTQASWFEQRWQWTGSAYRPYPGFKANTGAVGEYNGKFMANQWVLRGGSVATPRGHTRLSYRNFFYPHERWQFSGVRLAYDSF